MCRMLLTLLVAGFLATGCLRNPNHERPFTREWTRQTASERDFDARKARLKGDELVLLGKEGGTRAAVEMDEKGKPRLNVGKKSGLSADLRVSDDKSRVKLKYKLKWKSARPKKE